jgi:hypothetical protein
MPTVGGKKFGYSKKGREAAKAYAKKVAAKKKTSAKKKSKKSCGCKH